MAELNRGASAGVRMEGVAQGLVKGAGSPRNCLVHWFVREGEAVFTSSLAT